MTLDHSPLNVKPYPWISVDRNLPGTRTSNWNLTSQSFTPLHRRTTTRIWMYPDVEVLPPRGIKKVKGLHGSRLLLLSSVKARNLQIPRLLLSSAKAMNLQSPRKTQGIRRRFRGRHLRTHFSTLAKRYPKAFQAQVSRIWKVQTFRPQSMKQT